MHAQNLFIQTIGCQMNVYDSERIAAVLAPMGYQICDSINAADLIILNTCAIREKAEQKVFSFLGRLADIKRRRPQSIIAVGGCVAQQEGKRILSRVGFVDLVLRFLVFEFRRNIVCVYSAPKDETAGQYWHSDELL